MRLAAKLDEWASQGLIDREGAAAILAHENARSRPLVLWAVVSLGLLALALGIASLIAANWDRIADGVKLSVHFALLAAVAVGVAVGHRRAAGYRTEGLLFLLAALTIAGIALHSQIFQLTGPLWQALLLWAVLISPIVIAIGATPLTAIGLAGMWVALAVSYTFEQTTTVGENLLVALPFGLILVALAFRKDRDAGFRVILLVVGLGLTLLVASLAQLLWADARDPIETAKALARLPVAALVGAVACGMASQRRPRPEALLIIAIVVASFVVVTLAVVTRHDGGVASRLFGLILFLSYWGGIAALADRAGWSRLFAGAIAVIAVRLFIVYFELFYSLAFTGVGLIIAGLLLIALAWGWVRLTRSAVS